jgi:TPP-dependent pyruvate/acetoin dehydrogenase alpha subunit
MGGHAAALAYGCVVQAQILHALGDLDGAEASLAQALRIARARDAGLGGPQIVAQQVALAVGAWR